MTCDEIDELAGAIALDAIPPDEWPAINEHLATCPRGHPHVRELREVAVLLLEAAPPVEPPAALRGRILAAARAEAAEEGAPAPPAPAPVASPPTPIRQPLPRAWWANAGWFAAAAAAVVAAVVGLWALSLRDDLDRAEERLVVAERQLDTQRDALAALTGDGEEFRFRATVPGAGGSVVRPEGGAAALVLHGLPPVDSMTYQVWALRDGRPTSLGVFAPDPTGRTVVALNHDLRDVDVVAITLEPGPAGSPGPTSEPVLVAPLAG